tara:strand:+ start:161 stop:289 length:129 start_codon:yes stop_codon:yes gene_type:complete
MIKSIYKIITNKNEFQTTEEYKKPKSGAQEAEFIGKEKDVSF